VAKENAARDADVLAAFLRDGPCVVLTGAGCSTESGIPDYRGPDGTLRTRLPMRFQEFMADERARRRYWSRSVVGWPRFSAARPNAAHRALAALEAYGQVRGVLTQNVDGLHQAAGSRRVIDLHGRLDRVRCMGCDRAYPRERVQAWLADANPDFRAAATHIVPDGDAALPAGSEESFEVCPCPACDGILKPDVVFFGESLPKERVAHAWRLFEEGASLLVVGSSLAVFSGRRFVLRARQEGRAVAIVNLGATRCDEEADCFVRARAGDVLSLVAARLVASEGRRPRAAERT